MNAIATVYNNNVVLYLLSVRVYNTLITSCHRDCSPQFSAARMVWNSDFHFETSRLTYVVLFHKPRVKIPPEPYDSSVIASTWVVTVYSHDGTLRVTTKRFSQNMSSRDRTRLRGKNSKTPDLACTRICRVSLVTSDLGDIGAGGAAVSVRAHYR